MSEQDAADADGSTPESDAGEPGAEAQAAEEADSEDVEAESSTDEQAADATAEEAAEVDAELVDRVAESDPEAIAREIASLRSQVDEYEADLAAAEEEIEELTGKLKRKQADFQNFKKRMEKRREEEKQRATEDLVERLLDVRDNLTRALDQDEGTDIRGGIETTLRQFDDVLDAENVEVVEPEPGSDVDPHRHEVLVRVESGQPEDTIAEVHRPGYVMADKVLRPAQVTVSDGTGTAEADDEGESEAADGADDDAGQDAADDAEVSDDGGEDADAAADDTDETDGDDAAADGDDAAADGDDAETTGDE